MTDNTNNINQIDDKEGNVSSEDVLEHPHIAHACKILGIQKEWINTGSFYLWPISEFTNDIGIKNNIACGYVFSTFRAFVIKPTDKNDRPIGEGFIYFYGRCVTNPQASTDDWEFEKWKYEMKPIKPAKRNDLCCWFL